MNRTSRCLGRSQASRDFQRDGNCRTRATGVTFGRGRRQIAAAWLMLAAVHLHNASCFAQESTGDRPAVEVGSKAFTESVILGEILRLLAKSEGFQATHRAELGGSQILFKALQSGEIDAYCDYTGTIIHELLRDTVSADEQALRTALEDLGVGMTGRLGFNNTYAIGVTEKLARQRNLTTISDLARPENKDLTFGFSDEFMQREDGWPGLKRAYGLPQSATGMSHDVAYRGIDTGALDVIDLYTTDPEIEFYDLRTLEDDRNYFPQYHCVVLYRIDLTDRAPELVKAFASLAGQIDDVQMRRMNARVKIGREPEAVVAADFLNKQFQLGVEVVPRTWLQQLGRYTREHLQLVGVSLAAAVLIAVPLGIGASRRPSIGQGILGVVGILQTIPSMAMLVFMVPLLGLGVWPTVMALFLYSLLPIVRNTYTGLRDIPPHLIESAQVLGLPPFALLWRVELPLAAPTILAGIKTAAVINIGTATIGALIGAGGYGQPILTGIRLASPSLIMQGAVPAALMAIAAQLAFEALERWLIPGARAATSDS